MNTFEPGTFAPDPRRASTGAMVAAQARIESLLFLRHGEQQLLSLVIPMGMLIALAHFPAIAGGSPITEVFPLTLATAAMSAGFTGQAIAVTFDRRYGALKRIGASGVPPWTIIFGKLVAVAIVSVIQTLILGTTALILGWRAPLGGVLLGMLVLLLGVATATALGLLLGGTLGSDLVLPLANLAWFALTGLAAYAIFANPPVSLVWVPSVALAQGLMHAFHGGAPLLEIGVLAAWFVVSAFAASKLFKFTD